MYDSEYRTCRSNKTLKWWTCRLYCKYNWQHYIAPRAAENSK